MEIPIKMDDLGVPLFLETSTWIPSETIHTLYWSLVTKKTLVISRSHKEWMTFPKLHAFCSWNLNQTSPSKLAKLRVDWATPEN